MGKKKFSRDDDPDNSTDDEDPNSNLVVGSNIGSSPSCPHVGKAVNIADLKKALKISYVRIGKCSACERDKKSKIFPDTKNTKVGGVQAKKNAGVAKKSMQPPPAPQSTLPKIVIDPNVPTDVWLCLRCAGQSCSPKESLPAPADVSHAMQHFQTPRSVFSRPFLLTMKRVFECYEIEQNGRAKSLDIDKSI